VYIILNFKHEFVIYLMSNNRRYCFYRRFREKPYPLPADTIPVAVWVRVLRVQVRCVKTRPVGYPCGTLLASDGDSAYRLAKHKICMVKELDANSELGKILAPLFGLNCYTSTSGITWTSDPKHIFKRFATLLRNNAGFMVGDTLIRAEDIVEQLTQLSDMTLEKAVQLLDPSDKQNVPKAVNLLQSLLKLKELPAFPNPATEWHRQAIIFFAEILGYFFQPFITVDMTLFEQVESLATFAFGSAYLFIVHGIHASLVFYMLIHSQLSKTLYSPLHVCNKSTKICVSISSMKEQIGLKALFSDTSHT
jgi:hypothetical protein